MVILQGNGALRASPHTEIFARALGAGVVAWHDRYLPLPAVSCGVATYGVDGDRAVTLIAAADEGMYREKAGRRNTGREGTAAVQDMAVDDAGLPVNLVHFSRGDRRKTNGGSNGESLGTVAHSDG